MTRRETELPAELSKYQTRVQYVQRRGPGEWSSTCPQCGGDVHGNEWPDRCRWWEKSKATGGPLGWCRVCRATFFPDKEAAPIDTEAIRLRREAREREEAERQAILERFTTSELWDELHRRMTDENRQWWSLQGIPRAWQDFWHLGYTPDKTFLMGETKHHSPAYTIPIFDTGWRIKTILYRLVNPTDERQRYRPQYGTAPGAFIAQPDLPMAGEEVFVVEGGKKAMVVHLTLDRQTFQVIGVPSVNSWDGMETRLQSFDRVYTMFDPDSFNPPRNAPRDWKPWPLQFCQRVGKGARLIEAPLKPDDMILEHGATAETFRSLMKWARPVH